MNLETHNKYFRDIGYNTDPTVSWPPAQNTVPGINNKAVFIRGHHLVDQYRIERIISKCRHVAAVTDLLKYQGNKIHDAAFLYSIFCCFVFNFYLFALIELVITYVIYMLLLF